MWVLKTDYKSGQGPGGKFNGPLIKFIIQEDSISQLEELLPIEASAFLSYMRSIRELHYLCTQNELGDYQLILHDFRTNFNYLYDEFRLPMTLKIHVIYDHYEYFFGYSEIYKR